MSKAESRLIPQNFKLREHVIKWKRNVYKAADPASIRTVPINLSFRIRIRIQSTEPDPGVENSVVEPEPEP
jgi:hypothetical protein